MTTRHNLIVALAGLGLVMATPVQAAPDFMSDVIILAKRDRADEVRRDQQDSRVDRRDERRETRRERVREEPEGYGYGYERRQQRRSERDGDPRDRR